MDKIIATQIITAAYFKSDLIKDPVVLALFPLEVNIFTNKSKTNVMINVKTATTKVDNIFV